jgi:ectoine hydroxylase-related dioxygenase (phytanoyl-CoA dioxygenase family)
MDKSHLLDVDIAPEIFASSIEANLVESLEIQQGASTRPAVEAIELQPGDVSIHHSKTIHGSFENHSGEAQKVIVNHVFDAGCRLEPSKLPSDEARAHFPVTASGHLDPSSFPILGES